MRAPLPVNGSHRTSTVGLPQLEVPPRVQERGTERAPLQLAVAHRASLSADHLESFSRISPIARAALVKLRPIRRAGGVPVHRMRWIEPHGASAGHPQSSRRLARNDEAVISRSQPTPSVASRGGKENVSGRVHSLPWQNRTW